MKFFLSLSLLWLSNLSYSQIPSPWDGYFTGNILGIDASITAKTTGTQWSGSVDAAGYPLQLKGTVNGMQCKGTMTDPSTQESSPFNANLLGIQLTITIHDVNPLTGKEEEMQFVFNRSNTPSPPAGNENSANNNIAKNIDQSLIGLWRRTETYVSSGFSFATDYFMQFNANGVVLVSDGRTAGGGPSSSIDSGTGDVHEGTWKTEGNRLWMNDGGSGWVNYARYYVEGNSMMLTFANGKSQVWERL